MKKIYCVLVLLILFAACSSNQDEPPEIPMDILQYDSAAQSSESEELIPEAHEFEFDILVQDAWRYLERDGYLLLIGSRERDQWDTNNLNRDQTQITNRLIALDGSFDEEIVIVRERFDLFSHSLGESFAPFEVSLEVEERRARVTVQKMNYVLDFANGNYERFIEYRREDLFDEQKSWLLSENADGSIQVYMTYSFTQGASIFGDIVAYDTRAGDIWHLTEILGGDNQATFLGLNEVLILRHRELLLLDVWTGELLPNTPRFDYGEYDMAGRREYLTLYAIWHPQRELLYIAYGPDDETVHARDAYRPLSFAVFNIEGERIDTISTNYSIIPFIGATRRTVNFTLNGDVIEITTDEWLFFIDNSEDREELHFGEVRLD